MTFTDLRRLHVPVRLLHTNNVAHPLPCHSATAEGWAVSAHAERRNDNSVKLSQGDLMLCPSFDAYRVSTANSTSATKNSSSKHRSTSQASNRAYRPTAGNDTASNQNDKVPVKNLRRHQSILRSTIFFVFTMVSIQLHPIHQINYLWFFVMSKIQSAKATPLQAVSDKGLNT